MNIQRSSFARLDTGNPGRAANGNGVEERLKKVYDKMKTSENWRKTVLSACVVALAIDPLFLFIPEIDYQKLCMDFDETLKYIVCVLRILIDAFYVYHMIHNYRSQESLRGEMSERKIRCFLIIDVVSLLPIPQVPVLFFHTEWYYLLVTKMMLKWMIVVQYLPRIIRIYPIYKKVTKTTGTVAESKWIGAALNLLLFMLFSYVYGAFWYVSAIEKKSHCWTEACNKTSGCNLFCAQLGAGNNSRFLNSSCPLIDPDQITNRATNQTTNLTTEFDFGMYINVLKSGVGSKNLRNFPKKFFYCFWWGLQNLSTYAQGLKPGNSAEDIFFAIIICASGLSLFAVLIGNVQKYLQSTTVRVEEMEERKRDREKWMSSRTLPEELKERIRKYEDKRWRKFRGTDEESFLHSLPEDLKLEIKRHLDV